MASTTKEHMHACDRWEYLRRLFAGISPRDVALLCGLALLQVFGYLLFESSTVLSSLGVFSAVSQSQFLTFALVGRTVAYALAFAGWALCKRQSAPARLALTSGVAAAGGFVVLRLSAELAAYAPADTALPWLAMAGLLLGGGGALANLMWARVTCTLHDLRQIYLFVLLSNLVSLVVYLIAVRLPTGGVFAASAALLCASLILGTLWLRRRESSALADSPTDILDSNPGSLPRAAGHSGPVTSWRHLTAQLWRPALGTAILCFMGGLMLQMPHNQELSLAQFQETALFTQAIVMGPCCCPCC